MTEGAHANRNKEHVAMKKVMLIGDVRYNAGCLAKEGEEEVVNACRPVPPPVNSRVAPPRGIEPLLPG